MEKMEQELTTVERIRELQNQLRIAIQNHQLLYVRRRSCPSDPDIKNHMNVIQGLIISMGRTQASLLSQFKQEITQQYDTRASSLRITNIMSKHLSWSDSPKNIPVYKNNINKKKVEPSEKKPWGRKSKREAIFRKPSKLQSLLKVNNEKINSKKENDKDALFFDRSKIKIVYSNNNKKFCDNSSLISAKKLQSVLKPKYDKTKESLLKDKRELENGQHDKYSIIEVASEPTSPCSSNDDTKSKESPSQSESHSDTEVVENVRVRRPKVDPVIDKKFKKLVRKKKERFESTIVLRSNGYVNNCHQQKDDTEMPDSIKDISQEGFLKFFGLISRSQSDVLKRKRCERKRRSVAGQNNFYNDYFQPTTPKRTYTPRKAASIPTSPNNQVTVETAIDIDDEDEKPSKNSISCVICNDEGTLETCASCSEAYHSACSTFNGGCPTCSAQAANIKSIVGANSASSASSSELIKRYLVPNGDV
ncbi:uncharacterized protein LOC106661840 [Cimex lectularius]|uniref:Uncharacterized protein n=1 Tax=Cimex lectularius TaxID=79782 RepID=A0A8I6RAR3_CIMLE|nr:uncharacterized protein LOC106661840 [Cimex lectularius]XP_014241022.1 uncharacterized protein LOC106661840 [Cimex lectularius]XP_014241023.1 uncharacterized protein LOC106661840 [Cimex lectularius]